MITCNCRSFIMTDFSIIIPVYNAEKTLIRCLDSIKTQTFSNYEVILIDDGSTDNSLSICKSYETNDHRLHVVSQKNSGPSAARNAGLTIATGQWICFVDSDDYIESNYLQNIYNKSIQDIFDVIFISYNKIYNNSKQEAVVSSKSGDDNLDLFINLSEIDMYGYTWIKVFRREIIQKIKFDTSINLFEDEVFTCKVLQNCSTVGIIKQPIYNYNIGFSNSLIGKTHNDYCIKCEKVYSAWKELLKDSKYEKYLYESKANNYVSKCYYYAFERNVPLKEFFFQLKNSSFFQEHTNNFKFDSYVKTNNYQKLFIEKIKYQLKVYASKIFK